jgi:hypothetical protein
MVPNIDSVRLLIILKVYLEFFMPPLVRPDIADAIKNSEIDHEIGTLAEGLLENDDPYIMKNAVKYEVLNITTSAAL